jgi:hypothetical protein
MTHLGNLRLYHSQDHGQQGPLRLVTYLDAYQSRRHEAPTLGKTAVNISDNEDFASIC